MAPGMETKAIDGGMVVEPFATQFTAKNISFPFKRAADFMKSPPLEVSVVLYSKGWTDKNPDQAKAFTLAYLKGVRDYFDAMKGGPKRAEVVDICVKYTSLKDKAMYDKMQWSYMDPNGEISFDGLQRPAGLVRQARLRRDQGQCRGDDRPPFPGLRAREARTRRRQVG